MADFDSVVIGAGACGLACAAELAPHGSLLLVEKEAGIGRGSSSRNSEVLHAGLYYPPGSLKARLCLEGHRRIAELGRAGTIPVSVCGKLVLAPTAEDHSRLQALQRNALACGVSGLELLNANQVQELEPAVRCHSALLSPSTAILDSHALLAHWLQRASHAGAESVFGHELLSVRHTTQEYVLELRGPDGLTEVSSTRVVNAAGLYSDRVAALAGMNVDREGLRLHWNRGEYFAWSGAGERGIRHLLYPVPGGADGHLGVHLTLDLAGQVRFGPTASPSTTHEEDYRQDNRGRATVHASVSRWLPELREDQLEPCLVGIRARLAAPGEPARDFHLAEESARGLPGWVNLIGIESPGLTASPAIAARVASLLGFIRT
ncbi:MAG: NAD(P)/FAD-dependent oxidoreductase [Candidatus Delongbacteria bacterium]|nr:NAD(P)/FAD-dependent oxidoreductase [Candidatus Delongbacteria bacterium]